MPVINPLSPALTGQQLQGDMAVMRGDQPLQGNGLRRGRGCSALASDGTPSVAATIPHRRCGQK
ncbi:hypothetical protein O0544_03740 [Edwardsiella anguillarum]|nr:hypothetical protein [Edwardsiella anguillarum]